MLEHEVLFREQNFHNNGKHEHNVIITHYNKINICSPRRQNCCVLEC